jgi:signal transduction histidine kinase
VLLGELQQDAAGALSNLRDLARGIYPPLLADRGLVAALRAQADKSPIPVLVDADGIGRFGQDIEAAVYFCCLEALQNIAKYAAASEVRICVAARDGSLRFTVSDNGAGYAVGRGTRRTAARRLTGWSCRRLYHCGLAAVPVGRALVLPLSLCTA